MRFSIYALAMASALYAAHAFFPQTRPAPPTEPPPFETLLPETGGAFPEFSVAVSNRPPENAVNIVVIGDGYSHAALRQNAAFDTHVRQFIQALFAEEPFASCKQLLNIYAIRAASQEDGADSSEDRDERDTIFDAAYGAYGIGRLLIIRKPDKACDMVRLAPRQDIVVILVNDTRYGGSGYTLQAEDRAIPAPIYAAGNAQGIRIVFHELGHSLANLADEYVDENIAEHYSLRYVREKPNIDTTTNLETIKWAFFFTADPNAHTMLGAYEGAYYRKSGIWRPQANCLMRELKQPFCHVCRKEVARALFRIAGVDFDEAAWHRENPVR